MISMKNRISLKHSKRKRITYQTVLMIALVATMIVACSPEAPPSKQETPAQQATTIPTPAEQNGQPQTSDAQTTNPSNNNPQAALEAPPIPKTEQELFGYQAGSFAGQTYDEQQTAIEEELGKFPAFSEEAAEAYERKLLSLFAEPYPHPSEVLDQWNGTNLTGLDEELQKKEHYNVEIILDASGSMAETIGGKSKMELAKEAIRSFTSSLPETANVALRVYGHKGSGSEADKPVSCGSSELVYSLRPYQKGELEQALNRFKPTGWTPIALSLQAVANDLAKESGDKNNNIVFLVSDGVETCGGDPAKVAAELVKQNIKPVVNVVGFNVDSQGENALKQIAQSAGGTYATVKSKQDLMNEFQRTQELAFKWHQWRNQAHLQRIRTTDDRMRDIQQYESKWFFNNQRELGNLRRAINYLQGANKLTLDQRRVLSDWIDARGEFVFSVRDGILQDLKAIVEQKDKSMQQAIEDKYKNSKP